MRIFQSFREALSEIKRDVVELGHKVPINRWQGKDVSVDERFQVHEYRNYIYTVMEPLLEHLHPTQPWADAEYDERICGMLVNPGNAWKLRPSVWRELLLENGKFHYTYSERIGHKLSDIVQRAVKDPNSRQLFLSIWDRTQDASHRVDERVPCSLGYHFIIRDDKLHITYFMRSCDFVTHFENDVWMAIKLQHKFVDAYNSYMRSNQPRLISGEFTHFITSLHIYAKDAHGVF